MRWSEPALQKIKLGLAPLLWRALRASVRLGAGRGAGTSGPVIFACLHRDIIPALLHVRPARPHLLVSRSPDGDILIDTLGRDGFGFVRGSTGNQGRRAFVALLRALRDGHSVGIAVDGPKGPFGEIRSGVIQLSRRSGRPIVPLRVEPGRHRELATWDRTILPLPLSRVTVHEVDALVVPADAGTAEFAEWRHRLAEALLVAPPRHGRPRPVGWAQTEEGGRT
jgi:lysophospholipid acyltransferase (LPLAT)-like uncharacterized protein